MNSMHKKIMTGIFFTVIGIIPIISIIAMPKEAISFSENENRYLARFPSISIEKILDNSFMKGFEDWSNDRVIGRESFIKFKNQTERLLGKTEIDGVFTADDRMIQAWRGYDVDSVNKNLRAMNSFAERYSYVPVYFLLAPTSQEIYRTSLPASAPLASQKDFIKYCYDELSALTSVNILPLMEDNKDRYIYYRTDHHWTSLGAYIAYTALGSTMGFTPTPIGSFYIENASSNFLGTLYSKTLDTSVTPDIINIYTLTDGEPEVLVTINEGTTIHEYDSLYFREFLEKKDKYATFLGTNAPIITIKTSNETRELKKLLIFKDSYAHCLVPFLVNNYNEIIVADLRYINMGYNALFDIDEFDSVLFLYNVVTFSEDRNIVKLNSGAR